MRTLVEKLKNRIAILKSFEYENQELLDFYKNFLISDEKYSKSISELVITCYLSLKDDDFEKIKNEVYSLSQELEEYCKYMIGNLNYSRNENNDWFELSYFDNTVLAEKRYYDVLQRVFAIVVFELYGDKISNSLFEIVGEENREKFIEKFRKKLKLEDTLSSIKNKYNSLVKDYNRKIKKGNTELNSLYILLDELKKEIQKTNSTLSLTKSLIENINDDELKYHFYRIMVEHNNDHFVDVLSQNQKLKLNNISYLRYIFNESKHDVSNLSDDILKIISDYGDLENLVNILNVLKSVDYRIIDFNNRSGIIALVNTNTDILNYMIDLLKNGVINSEFIIKNQNILYSDDITNNDQYNGLNHIITTNLNLLTTNKLNINDSSLNEALLVSNDDVINSINLFERYNLDKEVIIPKSLLTNSNFFNYVDLFIELGLYNFIRNNFNIINDDCYNIIKRIHIARMMRISIFNSSGKLIPEILTGNDFYIKNSNLDNYIISESRNMMDPQICEILDSQNNPCFDLPKELCDFDKNFLLDEATYKFDNILISRNKVLKNYNCLRSIYPGYDKTYLLENSIIHNSILDIDSIFRIKDSVDEFYSTKQKRI